MCAACMCVCLLRVGQFGAGLGEWVCSRWLCGECVCLSVSVCECVFVCVCVCVVGCVYLGVCLCVLRARVFAACWTVWSSIGD